MTLEEAEQQMNLATKSAHDQRLAAQAITDSVAAWADLAVLRKAADTVLTLNKEIIGNPTT